MHADDVTAIATSILATVAGIADLIPDGSTVAEQVEKVGPGLLAELQRAVRPRYGTLPSPLPDDWRELVQTGVLAELLLLGYRNLEDDEKLWADEWRRRWENGVAALAAGVDSVSSPAALRSPVVAASAERKFGLDGFERVLG